MLSLWVSQCGHRRPARSDGGAEDISCQARPVTPDNDCKAYLTGNPDIKASRELLSLASSMTRMDKESFIGAYEKWYVKYRDVLNERVQDRRIKTPPYMRPRLKSAYLSIRRNMKRLWTFYDYKDRVIPNTNNGLEEVFADIKSKVRVHSGLTREHRMKLNTHLGIIDINILNFVAQNNFSANPSPQMSKPIILLLSRLISWLCLHALHPQAAPYNEKKHSSSLSVFSADLQSAEIGACCDSRSKVEADPKNNISLKIKYSKENLRLTSWKTMKKGITFNFEFLPPLISCSLDGKGR